MYISFELISTDWSLPVANPDVAVEMSNHLIVVAVIGLTKLYTHLDPDSTNSNLVELHLLSILV